MNSKISNTSDPHRLLLSLGYKIDLKRSDKYVVLSNRSIYLKNMNGKIRGKIQRSHTKTVSLKDQLLRGMNIFELPDGWDSVSDIQDYF